MNKYNSNQFTDKNESKSPFRNRFLKDTSMDGTSFDGQTFGSDRRTNLRKERSQVKDLSMFKTLSKNIQLPNFEPDHGKRANTNLTPLPSSGGPLKVWKPFYLSHHSEIMATKSVSRVHRRQDRVLQQEHLQFMTTNVKLPLQSSRNYSNVQNNSQEDQSYITFNGDKSKNTKATSFGSTMISIFKPRSKSIVPQPSTKKIENLANERNQNKEIIKNIIQAQCNQTFQDLNKNEKHDDIRILIGQQLPSLNYTSTHISNTIDSEQNEQNQKYKKASVRETQSELRWSKIDDKLQNYNSHTPQGLLPKRLSLQQQLQLEESEGSNGWTPNNVMYDSCNTFFKPNQSVKINLNQQIPDAKNHNYMSQPKHMLLNQNSSVGFAVQDTSNMYNMLKFLPNTTQMKPFLPNDHPIQPKLNSRVFQINDPQKHLHANLSVLNQLQSVARYNDSRLQEIVQSSSQQSNNVVDPLTDKNLNFLSTYAISCKSSSIALEKISPCSYNKQSQIPAFQSKMNEFDKKLEQTALDRKRELQQLSHKTQKVSEREFHNQVDSLIKKHREFSKEQKMRETITQQQKRQGKEPPFEELEQNEYKDQKLNKNAENVRQVEKKIGRTSERFMAMFDNTRDSFRENVKILEWQQQQQKRKGLMKHENIGFKDFVLVKQQFEKQKLTKNASSHLSRKSSYVKSDKTNKGQFSPNKSKGKQSTLSVDSPGRNNQLPYLQNISIITGETPLIFDTNQFHFDPRFRATSNAEFSKATLEGLNTERIKKFQNDQAELFREHLKQFDTQTETGAAGEQTPDGTGRPQFKVEKQVSGDTAAYITKITKTFQEKVKSKKVDQSPEKIDKLIRAASIDCDPTTSLAGVYEEKTIGGRASKRLKRKLDNEHMNNLYRRYLGLVKGSSAEDLSKEDPVFAFIYLCDHENIPAVSVLKQLLNKSLVLQNHKLTPRIWKALAHTINLFSDKFIREIYIHNSFVDDHYFPQVIEEMNHRLELRVLTLVKLRLGPNSVKSIISLIRQHMGLKQLIIAECSFTQGSLVDFLRSLTERPVMLEKIGLISMQLSGPHLSFLSKLVRTNSKLQDLDISWNGFSANGLYGLLQVLQEENKLKSLNLSWNNLQQPPERNQNVPDVRKRPDSIALNPVPPTLNWRVLCSYLKRSNLLQHIDLSHTFLGEQAVHYIIKRLSKSLIIQSVHLSGLQDQLTQKTLDFIQETLDVVDLRQNQTSSRFSELPDIQMQAMHDSKLERIGPAPIKGDLNTRAERTSLDQLILNFSRDTFQSQLKINSHGSRTKHHAASSSYILQRIIGHPEIDSHETDMDQIINLKNLCQGAKTTMKSNQVQDDQITLNKQHSKWIASESCWMCENHRYFIPMFLKSEANESRTQLRPELETQLQRLLVKNKNIYGKLEGGQPYIVGSITGGKIQRMKKVIELLLKLDQNRETVLNLCERDEKKLQAYYRTRFFPIIEAYLEYKPFFDRELGRLVDEDDCMYVHNDFVSPGCHTYFVIIPDSQGNVQFKKHYECLVKPRKENLRYKSLPKASGEKVMTRTVHKSQYPELIKNQWAFDLDIMQQEVTKDIERLNISKFLKQAEVDEVQSFLATKFKYLYMLYRNLSQNVDSFPWVSGQLFIDLFERLQIIGPKFPEKEFLRILAIIVSGDSAPGQEKKGKKLDRTSLLNFKLERYHFFEGIVRVAVEKYKELKIVASEALKNLFTEHFDENIEEDEVFSDIDFIENDVYQGQVNDIIYVNLKNLQNVYDEFKNENSIEQLSGFRAMKMLGDIVPGSELMIQKSFYSAKMMTQQQQVNEESQPTLSHLEFLVFLCFTAKKLYGNQKNNKMKLHELVTNLIQKLCIKFELQMEFPVMPLHDLYQNLSDDSDFEFDPLAKDDDAKMETDSINLDEKQEEQL